VNKKSGFTLIELLVVIAIIALLMGILMPALNRVKKQAKAVACQSRLREWGLIFKFYTDDYDAHFNPGWANKSETDLWMNSFRPYYKDNWDLLLCPTAVVPAKDDSDLGTYKAAWRDTDLPGGGEYRYVFSYSINSWTNDMHNDRDSTRPVEWFWKTITDIRGANQVPLFGDSTWHDAWPQEDDVPVSRPDDFGIGSPGTTNEMDHFCIDRHDGTTNFLFADLSTRPVGLKGLWTLKWHREFNTAGPWTKAGGVQPNAWPEWMRDYKDY
jgi:prepilin-type N-terminal cleavage/methylation domain-containing protein/prepilin-type processing-associated H-X9-DG protein